MPGRVDPDPAQIIGPRSGLSIALVVTVIGGALANFSMISTLRERATSMEVQIGGFGGDLMEIKQSINALNNNTRADIRELQVGQEKLRERILRLETHLDKGK